MTSAGLGLLSAHRSGPRRQSRHVRYGVCGGRLCEWGGSLLLPGTCRWGGGIQPVGSWRSAYDRGGRSYRHASVSLTVNDWGIILEPVFLFRQLLLELFLLKSGLLFGLIRPSGKAFLCFMLLSQEPHYL